jgi:acetoin:2,6-dichlorophenolindophenol oxidoreductase subunit beta
MRKILYSEALNEALHQKIAQDDRVCIIGQGVTSPWYVGNTTVGLVDRYRETRIIDTPVSENCTTGVAVGAALVGTRPILLFPRMDFMFYAFDPIANHAANWYYMFGGKTSVPIVIWAIINRGGEQAAQHSQALQALFAHLPGVKVVVPSTPYDVKGLFLSAIEDDNPVVLVDDRWLYNEIGEVPKEMYSIPIGKGKIVIEGNDITIIASSYLVLEGIKAARNLQRSGISVEVIDLRSFKPLDEEIILKSVKKTGRMIVTDGGWTSYGVSAEISAIVNEKAFDCLKAPVSRVALPDTPAPASSTLEKAYYPNANRIVYEAKRLMGYHIGNARA